MTVVVLGADGYLGWALTCELARRVREPLLLVDDLSKRRRVGERACGSVVPIRSFGERTEILRRTTRRTDIAAVEAGVEECIGDIVREYRPRTLVNLAQIPSAPFSMSSLTSARETLVNNEAGNLAVLFAMRDHSPATHLVKMGSMGEYAPCGVPLGEGYVNAVLDGEAADGPIPFPRQADDIYHITKINDTNFIAMACRVWGLAATDVMQSVVYGLRTTQTNADVRLSTRFDCDPVFGSVVNRFVAQAVANVPLTVHGGGTSTTGLIALEEAVAALCHWVEHPATAGEHRVINQTTETRITIGEIARLVCTSAQAMGLSPCVNSSVDPRHEAGRPSRTGVACNLKLRQAGIPMVPLAIGVERLLADVAPHAERLCPAALLPTVDWKTGEPAAPIRPGSQDARAGRAGRRSRARSAAGKSGNTV